MELNMSRNKAFFINGGAGRVVCSIPALEKFAEENPDNKFIIVCEGGTDFYKGHPLLHAKAYDVWHKNLFEDKLKSEEGSEERYNRNTQLIDFKMIPPELREGFRRDVLKCI